MVILSKIVATVLLLGVIFFLYFFAMSGGYTEYKSIKEMMSAGLVQIIFFALSALPITGIILIWTKRKKTIFS